MGLNLVEYLMEIEEAFNLSIPDEGFFYLHRVLQAGFMRVQELGTIEDV